MRVSFCPVRGGDPRTGERRTRPGCERSEHRAQPPGATRRPRKARSSMARMASTARPGLVRARRYDRTARAEDLPLAVAVAIAVAVAVAIAVAVAVAVAIAVARSIVDRHAVVGD